MHSLLSTRVLGKTLVTAGLSCFNLRHHQSQESDELLPGRNGGYFARIKLLLAGMVGACREGGVTFAWREWWTLAGKDLPGIFDLGSGGVH